MTKAWCVRADFGTFTQQFRKGGFAGIGWEKMGDLSAISSREELYPIYKAAYPEDASIPFEGQGAFITRADFQKSAHEMAVEPGFPRIGLVNGRQLVDLLVEHWEVIPTEFQVSLGLKRGWVLA